MGLKLIDKNQIMCKDDDLPLIANFLDQALGNRVSALVVKRRHGVIEHNASNSVVYAHFR